MKIFHNEEIYIKTDNFSDSIFKENTMFFDIETTGFSPVKAIVYMIGCARRIKNRIVIDQYFAETPDDEAAVIEAFAGSLSGCSTIISFNGVGFDIPFLKNKYKKYKQEDPFCNVQILDIFKELSPIKPLLCLENYKQKSIEAFLGIDREDKYSGGELINVYYEYLAQKDAENYMKNSTKKLCIVSQTTFNYNKFQDIVEIIAKKGYDITVLNTICNATEVRQTEARKVAQCSDVMIVIGDRHSSNTQKLFEICKNECKNTYYIQTSDEMDYTQIRSNNNVGITAGASTPNNIIEEVSKNVRNEL